MGTVLGALIFLLLGFSLVLGPSKPPFFEQSRIVWINASFRVVSQGRLSLAVPAVTFRLPDSPSGPWWAFRQPPLHWHASASPAPSAPLLLMPNLRRPRSCRSAVLPFCGVLGGWTRMDEGLLQQYLAVVAVAATPQKCGRMRQNAAADPNAAHFGAFRRHARRIMLHYAA